MFMQTAVVLFAQPPTLDEVAACLQGIPGARRIEGSGEGPYWMGGDGAVIVPSDSGKNGGVAVELFRKPWPDSMGSPEGDPELFGAWAMRHFGIATFPFALARALARHDGARRDHGGFVKLNLSYLFGAGPDDLVCPEDRDVASELRTLALLGEKLCALPHALGWFAPNGEVWSPLSEAPDRLRRQAAGELVPELWVSTRIYPAGEHVILETVGMRSLGGDMVGHRDHQLVLPDLGLEPDVVERFLQDISGLGRLGSEGAPTEEVVGPGGRWRPALVESEVPPPRELVRWTHESEAGSPVLTSVAELGEEESERWSKHLERHLGGEATVFHELVSDTIHLDVMIYPATEQRPFHVLVTQGMSALPMTVPDGAEHLSFAELMVALPRDWVMQGDGSDDERWYWPMRVMKVVARLPHLHETWIGPGHTIPNGDPAEPYAEGTRLCCVMVAPPTQFPEDFWNFEAAPGKTVRLYTLVPLYEDEVNFKLKRGADALFEKMDARKLDEVIDPERKSVLAKRFWIV